MSVQRFRSSALVAALIVGAVSLPSSLQAQQIGDAERVNAAALTSLGSATGPVATPTPTADAAVASGPRVSQAGISNAVQGGPQGFDQPQRREPTVGMGSNLAMMGVGAAALVVGLMVGGNGGPILALGGGVIGLVGLYRFLR
ncbi:MAG: hypothetical protein Q8K82_14680 [Gemmatimonadaceae bacterium]|nr:hypothetical protein [Gemmatimonadaceae bacterium]